MISRLSNRFFDWYHGVQPPRSLRLLSLPLGHQIQADWSVHDNARMLSIAAAYVANNEVEGDYLEFGVFRGAAFTEAWHAARRNGLSMRLHAFDSFEGLPDVTGKDAGGEFSKGQYAAGRDEFERNLRSRGVDMDRVTITPGWFDASLTATRASELRINKAAIVWIDGDLYASTVPVLKFITNLVQQGTILCFDDWYCFKGRRDRGEQLACSEWLAANPRITLTPYRSFHWAGQSFIVQIDEKS